MKESSQTTDYQDEWRDEMLNELLALVGWNKLALPSRENFQILLESYQAEKP